MLSNESILVSLSLYRFTVSTLIKATLSLPHHHTETTIAFHTLQYRAATVFSSSPRRGMVLILSGHRSSFLD
jgi:hypothetical protein